MTGSRRRTYAHGNEVTSFFLKKKKLYEFNVQRVSLDALSYVSKIGCECAQATAGTGSDRARAARGYVDEW